MTNLLTQSQVTSLAVSAGWAADKAKIIGAIAMVESAYSVSGRSYADADKVGDQALIDARWWYSYGLTQIRSLRAQKDTGGWRDQVQLPDPLFNLKAALVIYKNRGESFGDWTTYNNGQYKAFLPTLYPPPAGVHVVKSGDTLIRITNMYPDPPFVWTMLAKVNGLVSPYTIYINQPLQLPVWAYTVRNGDTLSGIATSYAKVTLVQLQTYNHIQDPNAIAAGDTVLIPHPEVLGV